MTIWMFVVAAWLAMWGVFLIGLLSTKDTRSCGRRTPVPWSLLDGGDPRP